MTRSAAQRRPSFGPTSSGSAQLRRSMGRTDGPGGDHVSEMRRNLDRFELERDLDRRHPAGESFYDGLAGRNVRGGEDRYDNDTTNLSSNFPSRISLIQGSRLTNHRALLTVKEIN